VASPGIFKEIPMKYAGLAFLAACASMLVAQSPTPQENGGKEKQVEKAQIVPSLFVMNAKGCEYSNGKLTLRGIGGTTVIFSDRPKRMAGHIQTKDVVEGWSEGPDSFAKNPPNADLSIFTASEPKNAVVELRNPKLEGEDLTFEVKVINGDVPSKGAECSLFIDLIVVARRAYPRAVFYSAPHVVVY